MYLGFHLDPIHDVHWNNLVDPISFVVSVPDGTSVTPAKGSAPKVDQATDEDPREFLIEIDQWSGDEPLTVSVRYFACSDTQEWCRLVEQT